jgi:hypothetical protein
MLARWIDRNWDLEEHTRHIWQKFGIRPAVLFEMSPDEMYQVISEPPEPAPFDHVAEIHRTNHITLKGKSPSVPNWFMKGVPRRKVTRGSAKNPC